MDSRRKGLKWLNFLYSFFGLMVVVKFLVGVGTLYTIIDAAKGENGEELFTVANFFTFVSVIFFMTDAIFKFLACASSSKKEGYSLMIWALGLSIVSNSFYAFSDQGVLFGLFALICSSILFIINYIYVSKRKWVYGNPDLL